MCLSQWVVDAELFDVKFFLVGRGSHREGTNGSWQKKQSGALNEKI